MRAKRKDVPKGHPRPAEKDGIPAFTDAAMAAMLEAVPSAVIIHDFNGKLLYANKKAADIHGYAKREFMSLDLRDINAPESASHIAERMRTIAKNGEAHFEAVHVRKDGAVVPMEVFVKAIERDGRKVLLSTSSDITERTRAEDERRRNEYILKEAQQLSHIGHWYWDITAESLVWSDEVFRIFDVDPKTFTVSVENFERSIHPDDLERFKKERERMLAEGDEADIDHRIVRPNREIRHVVERTKVLRDSKGAPRYVMGTVQDVTERMHEIESNHILAEIGNALLHLDDASDVYRFVSKTVHDLLGRAITATTKPTGAGTGLGLSITYGIVKAMGGDIMFESTAGDHTEVSVSIPAAQ